MKRILFGGFALLVVASATGCVAVSSKSTHFGSDSSAVAIEDRIYLVNRSTGRVCYLETVNAEPFQSDNDDND